MFNVRLLICISGLRHKRPKGERFVSLSILKNQIKSGKLSNLYLFYGPEEFLKKYYLDCMEKILVRSGTEDLNKTVVEGKVDEKKLSEYCEALPVFSDYRLVVVKNSGLFKSAKKDDESGEKKDEKKSRSRDDSIADYLEKLPPYTCLVFYEDEIDKRLRITGLVAKKGLVVEFPYQEAADLIKWIKKGFRSNGLEIGDAAASMLVEYCEPGMTDILNEINKLVLYKSKGGEVTEEDIAAVCTKSIKSRIFDLTDAIAEKNGEKALALLEEMIALKEPIPRIFYMITRQLRLVLKMKLITAEGISTSEAASRLSLTPYAARKIAAQGRGFTEEKLAQALKSCLYLDAAVKTGRLKDRIAAELLIAELAAQ